jgi:hypothetical protein
MRYASMFKFPVYVGGVQDKRTFSWIKDPEKTRTSVFKSVGGSGLSVGSMGMVDSI